MTNEIFYLSVMVATISWAISSEQIFNKLREFINSKNKFLGVGITCAFCVGSWIALPSLFFLSPQPFKFYIIYYFIIVGFSGVLTTCYAILRQSLKLLKNKAGLSKNLYDSNEQLKKRISLSHKERLDSIRNI